MSVYSALNDAQQRRAQGRWMAPHSDPCGWITRPTPAQRANKCHGVRCYQTSKDTVKMTDSRMTFASRDLCCSVPKVSSDQFCLLASAESEGERGRTGVASVSERARASEGVCYFNRREGCGSTKSRTSRVWTSWVSRAPTMGRRPKATCQFSARSTLGKTPYS